MSAKFTSKTVLVEIKTTKTSVSSEIPNKSTSTPRKKIPQTPREPTPMDDFNFGFSKLNVDEESSQKIHCSLCNKYYSTKATFKIHTESETHSVNKLKKIDIIQNEISEKQRQIKQLKDEIKILTDSITEL